MLKQDGTRSLPEVNQAMHKCFLASLSLAALGWVVLRSVGAEADKKTPAFPEPGSAVPNSFSPLIINGGWKDAKGKPVFRHHSVVTDFGLKPVVLVFARDYKDEAVLDFLNKLDAKVEAHQADDLCACAIFLCHDDKRDKPDVSAEELIAMTKDRENVLAKLTAGLQGLKRVRVGIDNPAGPKGYALGEKTAVMVVLYQKYEVEKGYTFGLGNEKNEPAFDAKAAAQILGDIDAWMAALKKKPAPTKK
jgi:hypothetical protein